MATLTVDTAYHRIQKYFSRPNAQLARKKVVASSDAISEANECFYRIEENGKVLKCAVGCLIAKKNYSPIFDTGQYKVLDVFHEMGWHDPDLVSFLESAQIQHDLARSVSEFLRNLNQLYKSTRKKHNGNH